MSYYIYKICCDDCPEFNYVGSTKAFRQRKSQHMKDCYNENSQKYNLKLYTTIRENGGWDNWRMVLIEECDGISFTQARIKEEENRVKLNANLNSQRCHLTQEAKQERDHKYDKEYYKKNKEIILEKNKEHYENNKEQYKQKDKKYYENNKEKILEWRSQRFTCNCGKVFRKGDLARHERTIFHQQFINDK